MWQSPGASSARLPRAPTAERVHPTRARNPFRGASGQMPDGVARRAGRPPSRDVGRHRLAMTQVPQRMPRMRPMTTTVSGMLGCAFAPGLQRRQPLVCAPSLRARLDGQRPEVNAAHDATSRNPAGRTHDAAACAGSTLGTCSSSSRVGGHASASSRAAECVHATWKRASWAQRTERVSPEEATRVRPPAA